MSWLRSVTLRSPRITLGPLEHRHCEDLIEAVNDGELFKLWYTMVPAPEIMEQAISRRLDQKAAGTTLPFVIIDNSTGKAVGMTNYLNVDASNRRLEIGGTWYRKSVQRTDFNTQAKFLLLKNAFEALDCIAARDAGSGVFRIG